MTVESNKADKCHNNEIFSGVVNDELDFNFGSYDTSDFSGSLTDRIFDRGCGVTLRDQFLYLGSHSFKRQVR